MSIESDQGALENFLRTSSPRDWTALDPPLAKRVRLWSGLLVADIVLIVALWLPLALILAFNLDGLSQLIGAVIGVGIWIAVIHGVLDLWRRSLKKLVREGALREGRVLSRNEIVITYDRVSTAAYQLLVGFHGEGGGGFTTVVKVPRGEDGSDERLQPEREVLLLQRRGRLYAALEGALFKAISPAPADLSEASAAEDATAGPLEKRHGWLSAALDVLWIRIVLVVTLAGAFGVSGLVAAKRLQLSREASRFVETSGRVTVSEVRGGSRNRYAAIVVSYEVEGRSYLVNQGTGHLHKRGRSPSALVAAYPKHGKAPVYYDPQDPRRALLSRELDVSKAIGSAVVCGGMLLALIALVLLRRRSRRRSEQAAGVK